MTISLCMIVKNEETMLPRCLDSVRHVVDEMVIVDTGSTDATIEIAERYGARVFEYPWNGSFANARNYAMQQAAMDWIFIMDADDVFEVQDTDKLRQLTAGDAPATAWFCKTLSYLGDAPDDANVLCNLNIYLVRNRMGYRFTGDIHEQISCSDAAAKTLTAISDMRVYHYGYLNSAIQSQGKRERNMAMIKKELEKRPGDAFMLYNLGNEYYAQLKLKEAYDCYLKSYARFAPAAGYSSKLVMRLIACCDMLGKTAEQLKYIEEGLRHYPEYTDIEFLRGTLWLQKERYLAAIQSYRKCLSMGEPPLLLGNIPGVGTYKAAQMLCQIHQNLGDSRAALRYARLALRFSPMNREVCARMASLLTETMTPDAAARRIARMLPSGPEKYLLLSDIFYAQHRWETALTLARKAGRAGGDADAVNYDIAACMFYQQRYREAKKRFDALEGSAYDDRAAFLGRLCALFTGQTPEPLQSGEPYFAVLERFEALLAGRSCAPLAADEESSRLYLQPILDLLGILLKTKHFDDFDKARKLLNLVTDDTVLLRLGKLYFFNGYLKPAYRELERSIKLTGRTDAEALRMMKYILDNKALE